MTIEYLRIACENGFVFRYNTGQIFKWQTLHKVGMFWSQAIVEELGKFEVKLPRSKVVELKRSVVFE